MFDQQIAEIIQGIDTVLKNRMDQLNSIGDDKLDRFQEMLNGIKITVNIEMPVVKKAEKA